MLDQNENVASGWKWCARAPPRVWCWLRLGLFFNSRDERVFLQCKPLLLYNFPQIFIISPLSRDKSLKNRLQSPTFIPQMVIDVWNIGYCFLTDHVPDKTHVLLWLYSPPYPQKLLLKLMTMAWFWNYGKIPCEDGYDYPKPWNLCKIWESVFNKITLWRKTSLRLSKLYLDSRKQVLGGTDKNNLFRE